MDESPQQQKSNGKAITIALIALITVIVALSTVKNQRSIEAVRNAPVPPTEEQITPSDEETSFWNLIDERRPVFLEVERKCLVDGTTFKMRTGDKKQDNAFGGVATDMMKIALSPPEKRPAKPRIDRQNFDLLLGTCPKCGATYFDVDIININGGKPAGAADKLQSFKLDELLPEIAARPQNEWTFDERALVRYITQRVAGFPRTELGYTALSGAYCGNLSIGIGRPYRITPAAFYALAAAEFRATLTAKDYENELAGSLMAMAQGELYRLLGRQDDAKASFALARGFKKLDAQTLKILAQLEELNEKGDFTLQRQPLEGETRPPLGWYIDTLLAGDNAELDVRRGKWGAFDDPQEIVAEMRKNLGER